MTSLSWVLGISILFIVLGTYTRSYHPDDGTVRARRFLQPEERRRELTHTSVLTGTLIPPDVLATMPPERRAKLEQAMQAPSGQPKIRTATSCITQRDLDQNRLIKKDSEGEEPQCTTKVLSKSSSRLVIERACLAPHASTSQMTVEATTPETVVASIDRTIEGSGKIHVEIKRHWLGTGCDDIEDRR